MEEPVINTLEEAEEALGRMSANLGVVSAECSMDGVTTEALFMEKTASAMGHATGLSRQLAAFLDAEKHRKGANKAKLKALQKGYVDAMKQLQDVQRIYARRHEAVIEYDLIKTACISTDDLKKAKEERDQALEIAEDAVQVNKAFQAVDNLVKAQTATITQIRNQTEDIKLEIGDTVNELEHARQLQRETMQKKCLIYLVVLLILAAIIIPIVLHYTLS
ncbi:hypothetical protein ACHHYP_15022 [Achlya hypogyna]|uniref:t-SNARE coiled-coil homology domain-containing protein n=1 Tax=Achlya hypogyna TaxID=1202772 RepID=A0A1V9YBT6_ACHHY|nr:hypothetical protein ACHHYP_15022 [Achlya hypogyna]